MSTTITVRTKFEGLHFWKDAPEKVAFLRNLHRHLFRVEVTVPVTHSDRDIEFFILKNFIDTFIHLKYKAYHPDMMFLKNLGSVSCEMIANDIKMAAAAEFNVNECSVVVQEDEESSGQVK